jgi:mono/diheme cytochrome c family protein
VKRRGFSLAELLLAFLLITVSVLFVMAMYTTGIRDYGRIDAALTSFSLAKGKMETLMACDLPQLTAAAGYFPDSHADFSYNVDVAGFGGDVRKVTVSVTHRTGVTRSISGLRAPNSTPEGLRVFLAHDCFSCHQVPGANLTFSGENSLQGPSLGNLDGPLATYEAVYGDQWTDSRAYLEQSVRQPHSFLAPGFPNAYMQSYTEEHLEPAEVDAIHQWLQTLPSGHS